MAFVRAKGMSSRAERNLDGPTLQAGPIDRTGTDGGGPSFIAADMTVVGNLRSPGDIQVEGTVEGDIISRAVTVAEGGHIKGSIFADTVHVGGYVGGEIEATSVTIANTAWVSGNVTHHHLSIERGAVLEGLRPWRPLGYMEERRQW